MRITRFVIVLLLALVPLTTLVHRNEIHRWDINREAMAAPDEFSYLLMADNLLHDHTISTAHTLGRDTFYPPGLPLLLAGWWAITGESTFTAHLLDALLLSACTIVVFSLARTLLHRLGQIENTRFPRSRETTEWLALLVTALFAANWHVLESGLFFFSEPAFMLATFAWVALAVRWRDWDLSVSKTITLALLAVAAWSIRGAGIVCVAATILYPLARLTGQLLGRTTKHYLLERIGSLILIFVLSAAYQGAITWASPEKSITAGNSSDNSYPRQLMHGLTDGGKIDPHQITNWPHLASFVTASAFSHLDDFSLSFTPIFRESPSYLFLNLIGKILAALALLGWLYHLLFGRNTARSRLLELYILLYVTLYLAWPFNYPRFWSPILPVMLVYAIDALRLFAARRPPSKIASLTALLLTLLLLLSAEELWIQLGHYERRLNYVSDTLADAANEVVHLSPSARNTIIAVPGETEHFVFAWYLPRDKGFLPRSPISHLPITGKRERIEDMLLRSLAELKADPAKRLFVLSYYNNDIFPDPVFTNLQKEAPQILADFKIKLIFRRELIGAAWEFQRRSTTDPAENIPINTGKIE